MQGRLQGFWLLRDHASFFAPGFYMTLPPQDVILLSRDLLDSPR